MGAFRVAWGSLVLGVLLSGWVPRVGLAADSPASAESRATRGPASVTGGNRLTQLWRSPVGGVQSTRMSEIPLGSQSVISNLSSREQLQSMGQFQPRSTSRVVLPPYVARSGRFWNEP